MKDIEFSSYVTKRIREIRLKDRKLYRKIQKQLAIFQKNPQHTSLRLHKLKGEMQNIWSISIDKNYRMLFVEDDYSCYFFNMGTHDEVYKRN